MKAPTFDFRSIIGLLIGLYGSMLLLVAVLGPDSMRGGAGPAHDSLSGLGLVTCGLAFIAWALLRPAPELPDELLFFDD